VHCLAGVPMIRVFSAFCSTASGQPCVYKPERAMHDAARVRAWHGLDAQCLRGISVHVTICAWLFAVMISKSRTHARVYYEAAVVPCIGIGYSSVKH
jgi:hypothetical protein